MMAKKRLAEGDKDSLANTKRSRRFVPTRPAASQEESAGVVSNEGNAAPSQSQGLDQDGSSASASSSAYTLRRGRSSLIKAEDPDDSLASISSVRSTRSNTARMASSSTANAALETPKRKSALKDESDGEADAADDKKAVKKGKASPFDVSPQKKNQKPIKLELDASSVKPAPKRWKQQLEALTKQRKRIIAPVDGSGCEDAGGDDRRADLWRQESKEDQQRRERFTILVSLMLSSQTKDEVTAQAVRNLQLNLSDGLSVRGILSATDDEISANINKVGFWRRKTGYIKSAASILEQQYQSDVPKDIDELCSLPGVGPKMAFLTLQSAWKINLGIGVDVHVHRMSNRLGWCKTKDPEDTRLVLQSWLPKEVRAVDFAILGCPREKADL